MTGTEDLLGSIAAGTVTAASVGAAMDDSLKPGPGPAHGTCHNCHAALAGPWCHACGQKAGHLHRPIWELAEDFLHTIVHWDSRLWVTLRSMLLFPARHLNDWINGRQMRHMPPIRLFVFISLLLLLLLTFSDVVLWRLVKTPMTPQTIAMITQSDRESIDCLLKVADAKTPPSPESCEKTVNVSNHQGRFLTIENHALDMKDDLIGAGNAPRSIEINGREVSKSRNEMLRQRFNDFIRHPREFNEFVAHSLTKFMLIAVPVHTLILGLLYLRRKRYLVEHVLFSMQSHTVLFLLLLFCVLLAWGTRGFIDGNAMMGIMILLYSAHLFWSMKHFYGDGWFRTAGKYLLAGGLYFIVMITVGGVLMSRAVEAMIDRPEVASTH